MDFNFLSKPFNLSKMSATKIMIDKYDKEIIVQKLEKTLAQGKRKFILYKFSSDNYTTKLYYNDKKELVAWDKDNGERGVWAIPMNPFQVESPKLTAKEVMEKVKDELADSPKKLSELCKAVRKDLLERLADPIDLTPEQAEKLKRIQENYNQIKHIVD